MSYYRHESAYVDEPCEIGVKAPGDAAAFVLRAGEQTFRLTDVSGVAELPEETGVAARSSRRFTLSFAILPRRADSLPLLG